MGVKVYSVVVILLISGNHVPAMPLSDCKGSGGMVAPARYSVAIPVKVGVKIGFTVIVIVIGLVVTHCPEVGVNV